LARKSFTAQLILPYQFTESGLVTAINQAIQDVSKSRGIDLGNPLDWNVIVREDYRWKDPDGHN
jgi:hypothetical protein